MTKHSIIIKEFVQKNTEELFSEDGLMTILIFHKLKQLQVIPNKLKFYDFKPHFQLLRESQKPYVSFELDDEALGIKIENPLNETDFVFNSEDLKKVEEFIPEIIAEANDYIIVHLASLDLLDQWKSQAANILRRERKELTKFRTVLSQTWGDVLNLLEILMGTSLDTGVNFIHDLQKDIDEENHVKLHVINRLFCRTFQVGKEILILLSHGLADGAEARWRTLHELVVITTFIMQHDSDVSKRYIDHEVIDLQKTSKEYSVWKSEGIEIVSDSENEKIEKDLNNLLNKYGKNFGSNYGWAAKALGITKNHPKLTDIEKAVGYNYLRPLYSEANSNIHATSRGAVVRLGLPEKSDMILTGHSIFGIGEVASNTAFLIGFLLENLLSAEDSLENRTHVEAVYSLLKELDEARGKAEKKLSGS